MKILDQKGMAQNEKTENHCLILWLM